MSDEEINVDVSKLKVGDVVEMRLEVNKDAVEIDDMFLILEMQAKVRDETDPKTHLDMLNLLDRVVVGGIRGRGIKLSDMPKLMEAVGQALNQDNDIKN